MNADRAIHLIAHLRNAVKSAEQRLSGAHHLAATAGSYARDADEAAIEHQQAAAHLATAESRLREARIALEIATDLVAELSQRP